MPLVIIVVFIGFLLWQVWPLVLLIGAFAVAPSLIRGIGNWVDHNRLVATAASAAVIARADEQHRAILAGDEWTGTYGDYPPADLDEPLRADVLDESADHIGEMNG